MRKNLAILTGIGLFLTGIIISQQAVAAIALDRTRVVFDGAQKSVSLNVSNQNKQLPYLAQGWIEDENGKKINSPFTVLPPVQRIEPGKLSQIKIQSLPASKLLRQDQETLYYFNLREIPPKSDKANTLQIALQTRIKFFYRPEAIQIDSDAPHPAEKITLSRQGAEYVVNNPTPYYLTFIDVSSKESGLSVKGFKPIMVAPKSTMPLGISANTVGNNPVLTYVNDYGGRPRLIFSCAGTTCLVKTSKNN